jgi:hypothetical protein
MALLIGFVTARMILSIFTTSTEATLRCEYYDPQDVRAPESRFKTQSFAKPANEMQVALNAERSQEVAQKDSFLRI